MGKINSKAKGPRGERELAKKLREYGYGTRRSQQYCGINGDADVVGLNGIHIECKRVENLNIYNAMDQALNDSGASELPFGYDLPTVFHRKNRCEWLVTMRFYDFMEIYNSYNTYLAYTFQKQSKTTSLYTWISKAKENSKSLNYTFVLIKHSKDGKSWFATTRLEDWINIYREWESGNALGKEIDNET